MRRGFTLVELLIVMAIIGVLAAIMVGIIDPGALVGRGNDARRKKDIARIKTSFEEYFNDRDCYPNQALLNQLMDRANCGSTTVFRQLTPWVCDPASKQPYYLVAEPNTDCPGWFKVFTHLDNKNDTDIPVGWATGIHRVGNGVVVYTQDQVNYGGSSTNVNWNDLTVGVVCNTSLCATTSTGDGSCQTTDNCAPPNVCYYPTSGDGCVESCRVSSCDRVF